MQLLTEAKIELIASDDKSRYVLQHPYLRRIPGTENTAERWELVATNGRMLTSIPVLADCGDTEGWVPCEAIAEARKAAKKKRKETLTILCNGTCVLEDGRTYPRPDLGTYPNVNQVFPKGDETIKAVIAFDPFLLAELAKSMNATFVTLRIIDENSVIQVSATGRGHAINSKALLVPARLS
jgi:hypothetical protein